MACTGGWMIPEVSTGGCPTTTRTARTPVRESRRRRATAGLKTMCGIRPSGHCAPNRLSSSVARPPRGPVLQAERDEGGVPAPLVRIEAREGTVEWPRQLSISTCTAAREHPSVTVGRAVVQRWHGHDHAAWRIRCTDDRQHLVHRSRQPALERQLVGRSRPPRSRPAAPPVQVAGARLEPVAVAELDVLEPRPGRRSSAANGSASSMFMWYVSAAMPTWSEPISLAERRGPGPAC